MTYKPLKIKLLEVAGLWPSLRAMRLPKNSKNDSYFSGGTYYKYNDDYEAAIVPTGLLGISDEKLAGNLIRAGDDHAKAMRGIVAWIELDMQTGFMIEFETYRLGLECLSTSSTMHNELVSMSGTELAEAKQDGLKEKVYKRIIAVNYQALRRVYKARRRHRHPDWQIFCDFVETLPYFDELILANKKK